MISTNSHRRRLKPKNLGYLSKDMKPKLVRANSNVGSLATKSMILTTKHTTSQLDLLV